MGAGFGVSRRLGLTRSAFKCLGTTVDDINPAIPRTRNIPHFPWFRILKVLNKDRIWDFLKIRVPYFGVLTIRSLLFRVLS